MREREVPQAAKAGVENGVGRRSDHPPRRRLRQRLRRDHPTTARSSNEPGGNSDASSEPNAPAPVTAATLGSPLTLAGEAEGVKVEVTPLEVVDPAPHDGVFPPEGRYVSIQFRLRNVGTQPYELGTLSEIILDETGERFPSSFFASDAGPIFYTLGSIPPGGEEVGFVTWDIPTGSTPSRVQYTTDNGFGPQTGEWTL